MSTKFKEYMEAPAGASEITYDNTSSGLTSTTVQSAIDELKEYIDSEVTDAINGEY